MILKNLISGAAAHRMVSEEFQEMAFALSWDDKSAAQRAGVGRVECPQIGKEDELEVHVCARKR